MKKRRHRFPQKKKKMSSATTTPSRSLPLVLHLLRGGGGGRRGREENVGSCRREKKKTTTTSTRFAFVRRGLPRCDAFSSSSSSSSSSSFRFDEDEDEEEIEDDDIFSFSRGFGDALERFRSAFSVRETWSETKSAVVGGNNGKEEGDEKKKNAKTIKTRTIVYEGDENEKYVERMRATLVSGGALAKCLNVVVTPRRISRPSFGADVLNFGNGKNVLIGIDFHPTHISSSDGSSSNSSSSSSSSSSSNNSGDSLAKRIAREINDKYGDALNATTPSEKFYEDASGYFSEEMFFARPSSFGTNGEEGGEECFQTVLECFDAYLRGYVEVLKEETEGEEEEETTEAKEAFRRRLAEHDKWQIERDPAIKMFSKWYGEEWANAYANDVLFPLAKECV